jgi:hypothetical protein
MTTTRIARCATRAQPSSPPAICTLAVVHPDIPRRPDGKANVIGTVHIRTAAVTAVRIGENGAATVYAAGMPAVLTLDVEALRPAGCLP